MFSAGKTVRGSEVAERESARLRAQNEREKRVNENAGKVAEAAAKAEIKTAELAAKADIAGRGDKFKAKFAAGRVSVAGVFGRNVAAAEITAGKPIPGDTARANLVANRLSTANVTDVEARMLKQLLEMVS